MEPGHVQFGAAQLGPRVGQRKNPVQGAHRLPSALATQVRAEVSDVIDVLTDVRDAESGRAWSGVQAKVDRGLLPTTGPVPPR
jgi:hypothetical protein